jgi:hypothetical protein
VSLYTGAGSQLHSGIQEAGLLILSDRDQPSEFHSTFIGVGYDSSRRETPSWVMYRVGDGKQGYRITAEFPDTLLSFKVTEGEYEIVVEHDIGSSMLTRIRINGIDMTDNWAPSERRQPVSHGLYGLRALMDAHGLGVSLQQFYWYYRGIIASSVSRPRVASGKGRQISKTMRVAHVTAYGATGRKAS